MTKPPPPTDATAKDLEPVPDTLTGVTRETLEPVPSATLMLEPVPARDPDLTPRKGIPPVRRPAPSAPADERRTRAPVPRRQRAEGGPSTPVLVLIGVSFVALLAWVLLH